MASPSYTLDLRRSAIGTVQLPGSKSLSNRALLLAALATGQTQIRGLLDSDDTAVMIESLRRLGARLDQQSLESTSSAVGPEIIWVVEGTGGCFPSVGSQTLPNNRILTTNNLHSIMKS